MTADGDIASSITTHISRILLRYFRAADPDDIAPGKLDLRRDRDLLRLHWSMSPSVRALTDYILSHRHETQSFLTLRVRSDDGPIRGRLDARATLIRRIVSGHPGITVSHEPVRSFASGPNHVLAWVLQQAWLLSGRFLSVLPADASYRPMVEGSSQGLAETRRIEAIRRAMTEVSLARRPSSGALQSAARSRLAIYRLAYQAYVSLAAIEGGDEAAIESVLRATLIAPIDMWRRFELAVGLSLAEALEQASGDPMALNPLAGDSRTPIAQVGHLSIFWQTRTPYYLAPEAEPSEIFTRNVLAGFGLKPDADRPDLIVTDERAGQVVAVVEVKFFQAAGEDAWDRLREATHQVVRYGRGYRPLNDLAGLVGHSVIALVRRPTLPAAMPEDQPLVVDFNDIRQGGLKQWADAIQAPVL